LLSIAAVDSVDSVDSVDFVDSVADLWRRHAEPERPLPEGRIIGTALRLAQVGRRNPQVGRG
jgi:hypothetical protein